MIYIYIYYVKNQTMIRELFIHGRKIEDGVSLLFLTQSYFSVPKIIRLLLKLSSNRDIKLMLSEYYTRLLVRQKRK